jgi:uncharacterized protein YbaP (TraB family)
MAGLISPLKTAYLCAALIACNVATAVPLWEIEGTDNRIRLLGSVHFLRAEDHPLPRVINDVYRKADVIIMELALDTIGPTELQRIHQELAVDPHGRKLDELIGAGAWRKAQSLATAIDIDLNMLQPFEPWFAALQITQLRLLQLGYDGSFGIETTITRKARVDHKPLLGLETLDEQLRALDTLPAKAQKNFLLQTLEDADSLTDILDTIVAAWKRGDIKTLDNLLLEGMDEQPEVYDQLLVQRNRRWTKAIIELTNDSQDYLIIVGALHLIGEDSVQNMLSEAGIQTRRLR